ncbi:hypothetical protein [Commensalibacter sp. W8163]|uniref:hypothetical protein n=1 Tax=Commensalibacter sp. W8163 TaxID=2751023 RepID=UPI0018DBA746|nr:hypothetical protein [Commensalibacter sp. W8163]MBI0180221.1 hypothetical protein [Commensalibacter sp. W8163]
MSRFDMTQGLAKGSLGQEMTGGQIVDRLSAGIPVENRIVNDPAITLMFPKAGEISYRLLFRKACSISLGQGQKGQLQRMTVILQQPCEGDCEVEFDASVRWHGRQPFIDTRAGSVTIVEFMSDGIGNYYGRLIYG